MMMMMMFIFLLVNERRKVGENHSSVLQCKDGWGKCFLTSQVLYFVLILDRFPRRVKGINKSTAER